jgi:hypothetical protein
MRQRTNRLRIFGNDAVVSPRRSTKYSSFSFIAIAVASWAPYAAAAEPVVFAHERGVERIFVSTLGEFVVSAEAPPPPAMFSPDTENGGRVLVWDTARRTSQVILEGKGIETAAFSPGLRYLATAHSREHVVMVWERDGNRHWALLHSLVATEGNRSLVLSLAFSPDCQELFIPVFCTEKPRPPSQDSTLAEKQTDDLGDFFAGTAVVQCWNVKSGKQKPIGLPKFTHMVGKPALCPKENLLLLATWGEFVAIDLHTGQRKYSIPIGNRMGAVYVSPNGEYALGVSAVLRIGGSAEMEKNLTIWYPANGTTLWTTQIKKGSGPPLPVFSPDSRFLAFCGENQTLQTLNIASRGLMSPLKIRGSPDVLFYNKDGALMAAAADGAKFAIWHAIEIEPSRREGLGSGRKSALQQEFLGEAFGPDKAR